ncbi:MAG: response regulator [Desulforhabdus sp.]|jgi:CheY-like chemotaxis protein|nr:response regulator [Desulforhabdus sp.]
MHRILLIDDDKAVLEVTQALLSMVGYKVTATCNGNEGLSFVEEREFDLIITDLRMPDVSGIEIARMSKRKSSKTPVIVLSGYIADYPGSDPAKDGIHMMLSKPFELQTLVMNIEALLSSKGSQTVCPEIDSTTSAFCCEQR